MMAPRQVDQAALFYEVSLERHVPADHLLRRIDRFVDLSEVRGHLAPFYSSTGRPSIDPELLVRMLLVGYCFGIRAERRLCDCIRSRSLRWSWSALFGCRNWSNPGPSDGDLGSLFGPATVAFLVHGGRSSTRKMRPGSGIIRLLERCNGEFRPVRVTSSETRISQIRSVFVPVNSGAVTDNSRLGSSPRILEI
jgi:hypothetical protein